MARDWQSYRCNRRLIQRAVRKHKFIKKFSKRRLEDPFTRENPVCLFWNRQMYWFPKVRDAQRQLHQFRQEATS